MSLLEVKDLNVDFHANHDVTNVLNGVSFSIKKGEILGLVGESGSGKSVTSLSILQLLGEQGKIKSGNIYFNNDDLVKYSTKDIRKIRGNKISMVFQEPLTSLNPLIRIGTQITESTLLHNKKYSKQEAKEYTLELMKMVGIARVNEMYKSYPFQLSGGMRQRVMIAIALACNPDLLIADEPTTSLDVTIQKQILSLMKKSARELNTSILFITHDLGVVAEMADRIAVMYAGQIVEENDVESFFENPKHPYSKGLINSTPRINQQEELEPIMGYVPTPDKKPSGCAFHPRCEFAMDICKTKVPPNFYSNNNELVNCWLYDKKGDHHE